MGVGEPPVCPAVPLLVSGGLGRAVVGSGCCWRASGGDAFGAIGVSIGTLTAFVLHFARFFPPLTALGDEWQTVQAALAGAERVFAVLEGARRPVRRRRRGGQPVGAAARDRPRGSVVPV